MSHTFTNPIDSLTRQETAGLLKIRPETLDRWRRKNYGPPSALKGGRRIYRRTDIEDWLQAQFQQRPQNILEAAE